MRAAGWRTAKSPRCQTSSSAPTASFQLATIAPSISAVVANGRLNSPRAPPWPKWWSLVKNSVIGASAVLAVYAAGAASCPGTRPTQSAGLAVASAACEAAGALRVADYRSKVGSAPSIGTGFMPSPAGAWFSRANTQSMPPLGPLK